MIASTSDGEITQEGGQGLGHKGIERGSMRVGIVASLLPSKVTEANKMGRGLLSVALLARDGGPYLNYASSYPVTNDKSLFTTLLYTSRKVQITTVGGDRIVSQGVGVAHVTNSSWRQAVNAEPIKRQLLP